eukprot:11320042-Ditylum_brightwellii.AAC.1
MSADRKNGARWRRHLVSMSVLAMKALVNFVEEAGGFKDESLFGWEEGEDFCFVLVEEASKWLANLYDLVEEPEVFDWEDDCVAINVREKFHVFIVREGMGEVGGASEGDSVIKIVVELFGELAKDKGDKD